MVFSLDLDAWINEPPEHPAPSSSSEEEETSSTNPVADIFFKLPSDTKTHLEPTEEQLKKVNC